MLITVCLLLALLPLATLAQTIRYVKAGGTGSGSSWANASGDQVWVGAGTYKPTTGTERTTPQMKRGVAIYGGFAGSEATLNARPAITFQILLPQY